MRAVRLERCVWTIRHRDKDISSQGEAATTITDLIHFVTRINRYP
jgi:hypothetical protein